LSPCESTIFINWLVTGSQKQVQKLGSLSAIQKNEDVDQRRNRSPAVTFRRYVFFAHIQRMPYGLDQRIDISTRRHLIMPSFRRRAFRSSKRVRYQQRPAERSPMGFIPWMPAGISGAIFDNKAGRFLMNGLRLMRLNDMGFVSGKRSLKRMPILGPTSPYATSKPA